MLHACELADLEHDTSWPCFPEIVTIWDSVSEYVLEHLAQNEVGLVSCSSPHETLTVCLVLTSLCHAAPLLPSPEKSNSTPAGHCPAQMCPRAASLAPEVTSRESPAKADESVQHFRGLLSSPAPAWKDQSLLPLWGFVPAVGIVPSDCMSGSNVASAVAFAKRSLGRAEAQEQRKVWRMCFLSRAFPSAPPCPLPGRGVQGTEPQSSPTLWQVIGQLFCLQDTDACSFSPSVVLRVSRY